MASERTESCVAAPLAPVDRARLGNWLLLEFILDVIAVARGDRHPMDILLMAAISQANVAPITQDAGLQIAYADAQTPPPDALRRPISANALAASLRMPFETVRRRVRAMESQGLCAHVEGGFIVPTAVVTTPQYMADGLRGYERLRRLHADMRRYHLLPVLPGPVARLELETFPLRLVARLCTDFVLRVVDPVVAEIGDLMTAILFLEIVRGNMARLDPATVGLAAWAEGEAFGDAVRQPVRPAQIAVQLNIPAETARRHAHRLVQAGYCTATSGGLIVGQQVLTQSAMARVMSENLSNLDRLLTQLARLGVLEVWDRAPYS